MAFQQLTELTDKVAAFKKQLMAEGGEIVKAAVREFIDSNPKVSAIRWKQYTPYFNDGDPCEFSVGDITVKIDKFSIVPFEDDEDDDYGDEGFDERLIKDWGYVDNNGKREYQKLSVPVVAEGYENLLTLEEAQKIEDELDVLQKSFNAIEDVLQVVFGDHITVTVSKDGIEIDEYDHD